MELYVVSTSELPDTSQMKCLSTFINRSGKECPEMDDFAYMTWEDAIDSSIPNMSNMLKQIRKRIR